MKISYYLPSERLTNAELEKLYNDPSWTANKIFRKTGIISRPIASDSELVSDLAVNAAQKLFLEHSVDPSEIDFILLCTQSPDYLLPTTACMVQSRLGIPTSAGALDFNLGCSGFIYGLALAKGLLSSNIAKNILLITSETYTKHIYPLDRSTRTIFGDAAAAVLIRKEDVSKIGEFILGTDGTGSHNLIIPAGGMAKKSDPTTAIVKKDASGNFRTLDNLFMNGPEIYAFTMRIVSKMVEDVLIKNNVTIEDIDYVIFHQANAFMLETLRDSLNIPEVKFCIDVEDTGNTVSPTIPIAIKRSAENGYLSKHINAKILIAGFGVGYSWGATIIDI